MKILVGCSSPPDRGSGILSYSKEIAEAFLEQGVEVHFSSPEPENNEWLLSTGIAFYKTTQDDIPKDAATRLLTYIDSRGIDAVVNNDNSLLQSIAPALRCPFISIGHLGQTSIAALACYRHEWTDYVVSISNDMQKTYVEKFGVPVLKCPVIYNGISDLGLEEMNQGVKSAGLRLFFDGGFNKLKGGKHLLKAVLMDAHRWKGISLDWYGGVPADVARKIEALPHVTVHGRVPRDELLRALQRADVLLFPSRVEGCPMAILEAMRMGVPAIVSDGIGAMRVLVTSGREGYVCYLNNWAEQMMVCAEYLRDNPISLSEMKEAARSSYLENYTSTRVARDLLGLIGRPTVDRSKPLEQFEVLKWHRPLRPDGLKSPFIYRICYRLEYLRKAGLVEYKR